MQRVARIDQGSVRGGVERTPLGGLRVPAALTRVGVFVYEDAQGREQREYKPVEEAFAPEAIESLRGVPVTDLHPPQMVDSENFREFAVGHVADDVHPEAALVCATLVVQDAAVVRMIESGERKEVSLGYVCDVDPTPGVTANGEQYDVVQRRIRYNHAALGPVDWGRAGPEVALRLNASVEKIAKAAAAPPANAGVQPAPTTTDRTAAAQVRADGLEKAMRKKIRVNGREFHLDDDGELAAAQGAVDEQKKKADDAATEIASLRQAVTDLLAKIAVLEAKATATAATATDPAAEPTDEVLDAKLAKKPALLQKHVDARLALLDDARKVLGPDADLKAKPADEIKRAVVAKALPSVKLDGLSEASVDGMFTAVVAGAAVRNDSLAATHAVAAGNGTGTGAAPGARADGAPADPSRALQEKLMRAGREPLSAFGKGT